MSIYNQQLDLLGAAWYPKGSIVMWPSDNIPEGWLKCDGTAYSYTAEGGKYKPLYDVIGTTFGVGAEGSTFKVPNMVNRFVEGASNIDGHTLGSYVEAGLPEHSHTFVGSSVTSTTAGGHSHTRGTINFTSNLFHKIYGYGTGRNTTTWYGPFKYNYINNSCTTPSGGGDGYCMNQWSFDASKGWSGSLAYSGNHSHTFTAKGTIGNASANQSVYGKSSTVQPNAIMLNYIIKY